MSIQPGTQLGGYRILARIGAGGMGEVFKALDPRLGREVAVKVLPAAFAADPERLRRFQLEARALAALSHPNVVQVHEVGEQEGCPFLVMELLTGETLRQLLERGRLPWRRAVELGAALADGLAAAHAKGIVHRDLKPENVIVSEEGHLKLLDFGLAKRQPVAIGTATTVDAVEAGTLDGALLGTVGYMSPEQVQGQPADARSDLFALGAVLYEMAAGRRAFAGASAVAVLSAILKDPVPEASLSGSGGTPELDRIIAHCLEKNPLDRFQNARDLAFALRSLLTGSAGVQAPPLPAGGRRRPWLWAAALAGAALLLGGVLVGSPWLARKPPWDPDCVAMLPLENLTGDPSLGYLGGRMAAMVDQELQNLEHLKVAAEPGGSPGSEGSERRLAEATRARYVASGTITASGADLDFQARVVDPWSGKVVCTLGPCRGPRADPSRAMADLRECVAGALTWSIGGPGNVEAEGFEPGATRAPRLDALLAYRKAATTFLTDRAAFVANCERALALDPDFFWPRYNIMDHYCDAGDYAKATEALAGMEAHFEKATPVERLWMQLCRAYFEGRPLGVIKAINAILAIHPPTVMLIYKRAESELNANLLHGVIRDLTAFPRTEFRSYGEAEVLRGYWLCTAYHLSGDYRGQLREALATGAAAPDDLAFPLNEAAALAALGRTAEVGKVLEGVAGVNRRAHSMSVFGVRSTVIQELWVHGHADVGRPLAEQLVADLDRLPPDQQAGHQEQRAGILIRLGRYAEALELYRTAASGKDLDPQARAHYQGLIGCLQVCLGHPEEARRIDAELAALTDPHLFGEQTYHRAGIAAQLGERDRAVALLRQASGEGFSLTSEPHLDPNLQPLHGYPPYEELIRPRD